MKLVHRRRLLDRFDERIVVRLTLVEAGAGFGKSTLIRQVLAHSELLQQARDIVVRCPTMCPWGSVRRVLGRCARKTQRARQRR